MKYKLTPGILQQIVKVHEDYWDDQRHDLYKYKQAYETKFWDRSSEAQMLTYVQTSDAYGYVESFIASLFARNPGVIVKNGIRGRGNAKIAQHIINDFLVGQRQQIENASLSKITSQGGIAHVSTFLSTSSLPVGMSLIKAIG